MPNKMERLIAFDLARCAIFVARDAGKPEPWSTASILERFKFCTIFREDDQKQFSRLKTTQNSGGDL